MSVLLYLMLNSKLLGGELNKVPTRMGKPGKMEEHFPVSKFVRNTRPWYEFRAPLI